MDGARGEARGGAREVVVLHAPEAVVVLVLGQVAARREGLLAPGEARAHVVHAEVVPVLELPAVADAARLEEGLRARDA